VLVSLISSRSGETLLTELTSAGVPAPLAQGLQNARDAVAMGVAPVSADMTDSVRTAVINGSGDAFLNGVHTAALTTGVLYLLGAVTALIGIRRR
jgi:hypothetical protein